MPIGRWLAPGFLLVLAVAMAPEAVAGCTCTWQNFNCAPSCGSCVTRQVSCTCTTDCGFNQSCFAGDTEIASSICSIFFEREVTCQRIGIQVLNQCASCDPGYYGPTCVACPGGATHPCNGHGTCFDGINGNGTCTCVPGYVGQACQYSDAITCNGSGTAQPNGSCVCDPEYAGASCNVCAADHYNYPSCTYCLASTTCNGHGSCGATGACLCATGYGGTGCDACAPDFYGYPACEPCTAAEKCSGHGTCDAAGNCVCEPGYGGINCLSCEPEAVELSCSDALDDDCDGGADCADSDCCSNLACAAFDQDGDFFAGCDCDDADATVWAMPGEARGLMLTQDGAGPTLLTWGAPSAPGGSLLTYETLRFDNAWDVDEAAFCILPPDPAQRANVDDETPMPGFAFYYLVRAVNGCPAGAGPLGTRSGGEPRLGFCP
ncbi:MAG: hypothetical protein ACRD5D_03555 [Candidatus Polarisedimenticolia bacterium]